MNVPRSLIAGVAAGTIPVGALVPFLEPEPLLPLGDQLPLWMSKGETLVPWCDATAPRFVCMGCGFRPVYDKRTYCKRCKARLAIGLPVDLDQFPTKAELEALSRRMPSGYG